MRNKLFVTQKVVETIYYMIRGRNSPRIRESTRVKISVSRRTLDGWPKEIKENYEFTYDESRDKAIKAVCKVCRKNCSKLVTQYRGKVVTDVTTVNTGQHIF